MNRRRPVLTMIGLAWSMMLLPFAAPVADAKELKQVPNLQVFDANSKLLGKVESFQGDGDVQVIFRVDKSVFYVKVLRTGFTSEETLYYESTDCTGPALDDAEGDQNILPEGIIGPDGGTVYLKNPSATAGSYHIRSEWTEDEDDDTSLRVCREVDYLEEKIPTIAVINLLDVFTPPFSVR